MSSVGTTKKRRCGLPKDDRDYEEEESKEEPKLKMAKTYHHRRGDTIDVFFSNADVISEVFSFLDLKDLCKVAFRCNKTLRSLVRHEHVVRSAIFHGGAAAKTMASIAELVEARRIWIPSPLRLLRLVTGKRCESVVNGKKDKFCLTKVNKVPTHGVFFCQKCHERLGSKDNAGDALNLALNFSRLNKEPRALVCRNNKVVLWGRQYTDGSGERCGPIITAEDHPKDYGRILSGRDKEDPYAFAAPEIVRVFNESVPLAAQRSEKQENERKQAIALSNQRRKKATENVIAGVSRLLGDVWWKERALDHTWIEPPITMSWKRTALVKFIDPLVDGIMKSYIMAPSKATTKARKQIVERIREHYPQRALRGESSDEDVFSGSRSYRFRWLDTDSESSGEEMDDEDTDSDTDDFHGMIAMICLLGGYMMRFQQHSDDDEEEDDD